MQTCDEWVPGSQGQFRQSFYFTSGFVMLLISSFSEYDKLRHTISQGIQVFFF